MMYCPKVNSECIKDSCYAFKTISNQMQCKVCKEKFNLGGNCSENKHKRYPVNIGETAKCIEYDVVLVYKYKGLLNE